MEQAERKKRNPTPAERQAAVDLRIAVGFLVNGATPYRERVPIEGGHEGAGVDFSANLDRVIEIVSVPNQFGEPIPSRDLQDWLKQTIDGGNALVSPTWGAAIAEALEAEFDGEFADGELERLWTSLDRRAR